MACGSTRNRARVLHCFFGKAWSRWSAVRLIKHIGVVKWVREKARYLTNMKNHNPPFKSYVYKVKCPPQKWIWYLMLCFDMVSMPFLPLLCACVHVIGGPIECPFVQPNLIVGNSLIDIGLKPAKMNGHFLTTFWDVCSKINSVRHGDPNSVANLHPS